MKEPLISWILNEKPVNAENYVGSFETADVFKLEIQLWNNRYGMETVKDIQNGKLLFEFKDYEDSVYLNHLRVQFDHLQYGELSIEGNRAYVPLPKSILGTTNKGSESDYSNYVTITITLTGSPDFKNDLKQLIIDVI